MNHHQWSQIRTQRRIEWWSLLNAFVRPSDLPTDWNEAEVFTAIELEVTRPTLLAFWNDAFQHGLNRNRFA